ncbi:DNA primase [Motilimonas pumila]|uniref:DNA primase n=1 Tax=Motilimonas pumila TaxID=2303987 RepID=A0A418YAT8_9GAMM|nr:DNA primase [Motilimonas pumila]RJG40078.1 DNA primase [Motilimonas pumila]
MAGRIPRDFIDSLLARADIVDVVDSRVKLKKAGQNHQACCPFHNEKSPSFTVSQSKQFYHCFGCGAHGNAISFVMEYDGLEFPDAVEELASSLGLEVPREQSGPQLTPAQVQGKKDLYQLMEQISQFYQSQLSQPSHQHAVDYLKGRGLSGEICQHFGIGYIPEAWDEVRKRFGRQSAAEKQLIEGGMLIAKEQGGSYDRFRNRIMFPIRDRRGRVIGFGGRVLGDGTPKYLNSPETPIFHKGRELYALYEVKKAYKDVKRIMVVEGYMDVVALAQFGIDYAVASLGTSTTPEHIQTLFRTTDEVICCYDGDRAGRDAAWRALENALPYIHDGKALKFMFLPDGEDPDSMVRQEGKEAFEARLGKAAPLSDFLYEHLLQQVDMSSSDSKTKLAQLAFPLIAKLPTGVFSQMMREKLARLLAVDQAGLDKLLPKTETEAVKKPQQKQKVTPMRLAVALVVQYPNLAQDLPPLPEINELNLAGSILFAQILEMCQQQPHITTGQLIEHWRGTQEGAQLAKLAMWDHHIDEPQVEAVFLDTLDKLLSIYIEQKEEKLLAKARTGQLSLEEKKQLTELIQSRKIASPS